MKTEIRFSKIKEYNMNPVICDEMKLYAMLEKYNR